VIQPRPTIRSLVCATDIEVLARDHVLERRPGHWVVGSPTNPTFWWGNFLLFDDAPQAGEGELWEALFTEAFAERPEVTHRAFGWDRTDGVIGAAQTELVTRGYELEVTTGLTATPMEIHPHSRANAEVEVRALDPAPGGDEPLWDQVLELQLANAPGELHNDYHRTFLATRQRDQRERFRAGDGAWYVALHDHTVVGSLGIIVSGGRARYQTVDTAAAHRGRGVATRLVVDAARHTASRHEVERFVIAADPDYHAISIYESVGFSRAERVTGALRKPHA
jgi:ribosomal protein S18 acetylase RimI-like enzyme